VVGNLVSSMGSVGRTSYQKDYIQALLTTKIVVVAQRDQWEDHYRFFEAIIGGALVMTDPMLTLPDGYVDGGNILIYQSLDHMRDLIIYYLEHPEERLEIARKGWELAMNRHQTFHWMEETFFGKALSNVSITHTY
jgi:spore maturation protein CgeB